MPQCNTANEIALTNSDISKIGLKYLDSVCWCMVTSWGLGTRLLCYLLCYAALLKNFAYYAQIMLTETKQFPDIYSMHCLQICTFIGK